jgi:hypothetical protein
MTGTTSGFMPRCAEQDLANKDVRNIAQLSKSDLPALWKPRADQFLQVEALPYLGTGKLDLWRLKEIAMATVTDPIHSPHPCND